MRCSLTGRAKMEYCRKNETDLNEDNLTGLPIQILEWGDNPKNEDNFKNEDNLKNEDVLKKCPSPQNFVCPPPLKKLPEFFFDDFSP